MQQKKCSWCIGDPLYEKYHDQEWGVPLKDDKKLFEFLTLEIFQAGLSWITILKKRENFKVAFKNFDYLEIAYFNTKDKKSLLNNKGIVRSHSKINATIENANAFIEIKKNKGSFSNYLWSFVDGSPIENHYQSLIEIPSTSLLAKKICTDLKQNGFKFIGPTLIYSFMQATGMVNNHLTSCYRHSELILKG